MRRPQRLERLPQQYFVNLLGACLRPRQPKVARRCSTSVAATRRPGPPPHVIEALRAAALEPGVHGYAPIRGLAPTREAIAARYRDVYGVALDPETEVALDPGHEDRRSSSSRSPSATRATRCSYRIRTTPTIHRAPRSPAHASRPFRLRPEHGWAPDLSAAPAGSALYLNYPSNPCAVCAPDGIFDDAVAWARRTGGAVVHDAAYIDIVFDERRPESFLSAAGAKDVGVEMWSMSKTYGMAGWRIGFVVGNAEIVERINLFNDHSRVGIFAPLQLAAVAALQGPQDSVAERVEAYERRRDLIVAALPDAPVCEGTFYIWVRLPEGLTAEQLLLEHRVAVAPGEGFGPSGAGWIRLSVAVTDAEIELGVERLQRAFAAVTA